MRISELQGFEYIMQMGAPELLAVLSGAFEHEIERAKDAVLSLDSAGEAFPVRYARAQARLTLYEDLHREFIAIINSGAK